MEVNGNVAVVSRMAAQQTADFLTRPPAARRFINYFCGGRDCTWRHVVTFLLTFFSYSLFHASRKTVSNTKSSFVAVWVHNTSDVQDDGWTSLLQIATATDTRWETPDHDVRGHYMFSSEKQAEEFLGLLDSLFLGAYAIGLYISGMLGDRYDPRLVLSLGMCSSAVCVFVFGTLTEWLKLYNAPFYVFVWTLCGLLQSTGWPTEVCVMGNWFGRGSRGAVLGLWSACASIGNIIGTYLSAWMLPFGYEYAFLINALSLFVGGIVIFCLLAPKPSSVGLPDPVEEIEYVPVEVAPSVRVRADDDERPQAISFWRALLLPGVLAYSLCYACVKLINYSFFFWLPFFLTTENHWSEESSDRISTFYDWGGIVAGFLAGILTDHLSSRTPVVAGMLTVSIGAIFAYKNFAAGDKVRNVVLLTIMGFFIGGPSNLISAAVSADLGRQPEIRGNAEALATVTGIVDGTGSVGASFGQIMMPLLMRAVNGTHGHPVKHNDELIYDLFMIMSLLSVLCLLPLLIGDLMKRVRQRQAVRYSPLPSVDVGESDNDVS